MVTKRLPRLLWKLYVGVVEGGVWGLNKYIHFYCIRLFLIVFCLVWFLLLGLGFLVS